MNILEGLNLSQKEAVLTIEGPLLVIAGAGSGKTKVLVHRIAHLISQGVQPQSILAVTFTNKAAREMKERVSQLIANSPKLIPNSHLPWIGTFHALGVYILRQDGQHIDIPRNFSILDEDDAQSIIKRALKKFDLDPKQFQPSRIRSVISKLKNASKTPESYVEEAAEELASYPKAILNVFTAYEEELKESKSLDFDDLLLKTVHLLKIHPETLQKYRERWSHILVDEYQDTNQIQYELTKMLAQESGNIMVVGDVDQAIYSWRGADYHNILNFEQDWPKTLVITLEQNYRSTEIILEAANTIIKKNAERREKNLWTSRSGGTPLAIHIAEDEKKEADIVANKTLRLSAQGGQGVPLNEIAVLYRTNAQSRAIEEAFIKRRIPYKLVGGVRFYERREIKDMLAYVRAAANPEDALAKRRIINVPTRGIGKALAEKYFGDSPSFSPKEAERIETFERILTQLREAYTVETTSNIFKKAIKLTGYDQHLRDGTPEGEDRWANLQELFTVTGVHDSLPPPEGTNKFLEEVSLLSDGDLVDKSQDAVHLMTVHAAKGLEFEAVFVVGLEEGIFPHSMSMGGSRDLEEERRLCYVALTRAKSKLHLSLARTRTMYGERSWNEPSRFLRDIPVHLWETPPDFDGEDMDIVGYE